jgi:phage/plasmid-like protein (TIGR03299 family)
MSHDISISNGRAELFSGSGQTPWHGLGTIVSGLLNSADALKAAGLDWQVVEHPVFAKNGEYVKADGYKAICRADNGKVLSVMSDRYAIIQNADAFSFFDAVTQSKEAVYDTAGALRGGARLWIMAKLPGSMFINGDEHEKMVLLVTSHDGSYSLMMQQVLVRVVCQNTLSLALRSAVNQIKIRHCEKWKDKEKEARAALGIAEKYFASIQEALGSLGSHLLSKDEMREFTRALVPADDEKDVPTRTRNIRDDINRLFQRGAGNRGATRWDALQAVTDYVDHSATIRGESTRLESGLLAAGARLKQKAYDTLTSEELMSRLLDRPMVPESRTLQNDFARLLNQ